MKTNVESLKALYVKLGGSLTDYYSDIAGGIPVAEYDLISDCILACAKKASSGGGGGSDLPEVTTDDNGDVLTVVEGAWAKADAPSGLPEVTSANAGEILKVNSLGEWENANAETLVVTATPTSLTEATIDVEASKIYAAYNAGVTVLIKIPANNLTAIVSYATEHDGIYRFVGVMSGGDRAVRILTINNLNAEHETTASYRVDVIPMPDNSVSQTDNGKVLSVVGDAYALVAPEDVTDYLVEFTPDPQGATGSEMIATHGGESCSVADVVAAYEAGKTVKGKVTATDNGTTIVMLATLSSVTQSSTGKAVVFGAVSADMSTATWAAQPQAIVGANDTVQTSGNDIWIATAQ